MQCAEPETAGDPPTMPSKELPSSSRSLSRSSRKQQAVIDQINALGFLDLSALREQWADLYSIHPPQRLSRCLLELGIAYKLQETVFDGGLGAIHQRQLREYARDLQDNSGTLPVERIQTLSPGTKLVREWGGMIHEVLVCEDGFEWNGQQWRSLSVIARTITGAAWSGPRFFGLKQGQKVHQKPALEKSASTGTSV